MGLNRIDRDDSDVEFILHCALFAILLWTWLSVRKLQSGFTFHGEVLSHLSINLEPHVLASRILWALDLEFWYLRSLKFIIALKSLGPKLFMLKNMVRNRMT